MVSKPRPDGNVAATLLPEAWTYGTVDGRTFVGYYGGTQGDLVFLSPVFVIPPGGDVAAALGPVDAHVTDFHIVWSSKGFFPGWEAVLGPKLAAAFPDAVKRARGG